MAKKTIILVRHGQYHQATDNELERLTKLGRKQAKYASKRLKDEKIDRIVHSTMPRAIETASIIKKELGYKRKLESCDSLCECVPGFPKELRKEFGFTDEKKLKLHKAQADRAFKKYFQSPKKNSVEVLVCHGNIIRYLICRLLEIDTLTWRKLDIQQCGISIIEVRSSGPNPKVVLSHNDVGHIPKNERTFV